MSHRRCCCGIIECICCCCKPDQTCEDLSVAACLAIGGRPCAACANCPDCCGGCSRCDGSEYDGVRPPFVGPECEVVHHGDPPIDCTIFIGCPNCPSGSMPPTISVTVSGLECTPSAGPVPRPPWLPFWSDACYHESRDHANDAVKSAVNGTHNLRQDPVQPCAYGSSRDFIITVPDCIRDEIGGDQYENAQARLSFGVFFTPCGPQVTWVVSTLPNAWDEALNGISMGSTNFPDQNCPDPGNHCQSGFGYAPPDSSILGPGMFWGPGAFIGVGL